MTCLTPEGTRDDSNNCIQVIQAKFNRPYQKVFNNSLEFRLIYSYTDVIITYYITHTYYRSFYKLIKAGSDFNRTLFKGLKKGKQKFLFLLLWISFRQPNQTFAVSVESTDVASERPILFVVRQQKTVTSWELPFEYIHKQDTLNSFFNKYEIHSFFFFH